MAKNDDDDKHSENPPHNRIDHEKAENERIRLFWHHKRAGTLEVYYTYLYPGDRRPRPKGRGGR